MNSGGPEHRLEDGWICKRVGGRHFLLPPITIWELMSMRNRAEKRHNDWKKAIRKRRIVNEVDHYDMYDNLHQYSKNKNFCSCWMCRWKTNNKGRHRSWAPSKFWSQADRRRLDEMEDQLLDNE